MSALYLPLAILAAALSITAALFKVIRVSVRLYEAVREWTRALDQTLEEHDRRITRLEKELV